jgi:small subunit ribosomal protein S8
LNWGSKNIVKMSQDVVSDGLNQIMNCKRAEKKNVVISRYSKVLLNLFELMKNNGHIDYVVDDEKKAVVVDIIKLNKCRAIKPRYFVGTADINKYLRRFLPSRNFGTLVISTNKGLLPHKDAIKNNLGGSVVAYFY